MSLHDELERIKKQDTKPKKIIKFPCKHGSTEIEKSEDQYITCPVCRKSFLLTWSMTQKGIHYGRD